MFQKNAASDLWRHTLSQIPSVFGRLVYLSSLRNANTGIYEHQGLALRFGDQEANRVLLESHLKAFEEWLSYTLEQQKADLDLYLASLDANKKTVLDNWTRLSPYQSLVPALARDVERELYLSDLRALLDLLKNECGVALSDRES